MKRILVGAMFLVALAAWLPVGVASGATPPVDAQCAAASPSAALCIGLDKLADGGANECRAAGLPDEDCVLPAGHAVRSSDMAAYMSSWTRRTIDFQSALGDPLPLNQAQWLGTHNSFNSLAYGPTISHLDSNQQLTLSQQLDLGIREIELDPHWLPAANGELGQVVICHGRPPSEENFGCTTEAPFTQVLAEIDAWLNGHPGQVIMLYLDDNLSGAQQHSEAAKELATGLTRADGTSLIYAPTTTSGGCARLPLSTSRDAVRAAGRQVIVVATTCSADWSGQVFSWGEDEVESGSTTDFKAFPACDASYGPSVYASHIVRYFEDSTFVSAATTPTETPAQDQANSLTPQNVAWMTACGVDLLGFDQILPNDGRLAATIWSWADNQPDTRAGHCTAQQPDGRWATTRCAATLPAACVDSAGQWSLTALVAWREAQTACMALGASFGLPRTGLQNSQLHEAAGARAVWLALRQ